MGGDTDIKVGDLVRAFTPRRDAQEHTLPSAEGIVTEIRKREVLFSEKYAITETETSIYVLADGKISIFYVEEDYIEVISESG